jgi:choline dehydrogenase
MVYLRGAASDYDNWAALGCADWGWESVRAEFDDLETWLRPAVLQPHNPLSAAMVEAAVQAGFPPSASFDNGTLEGAGWNKATVANSERFNAHLAFIAPIRDRPNLQIRTETRALRLATDGADILGVVVQRSDGGAETIPTGEVILCAGAFDSPRILLHSGIGPASHLEQTGLVPVADLPVGENLIDHLLVGIVYNSRQPISDVNAYNTEACAFTRSSLTPGGCDIEISFAKEPHFAPETHDGVPRFTIIPGITRPRSRGTVRLTGNTSDSPLAIDPNYFSHPDDMAVMIEAVRLAREIAEQDALREWNAGEHFPGPAANSDARIANYVTRVVSTWFHPVGTCRMGVGADAVVDPNLRVRGVRGLRVADASVMPDIVSVNTQAASMMIGWKGGKLALA